MKQQITSIQWNELSWEEKDKMLNFVNVSGANRELRLATEYLFDIGQLIEYLGDDFHYILDNGDGYSCKLMFNDNTTHDFTDKELIDALWESVKQKLKT